MHIILLVISGIVLWTGLSGFTASDNSIHQIAHLIMMLISAVLFSAAAIIDAIKSQTKKLAKNEIIFSKDLVRQNSEPKEKKLVIN